MTFHQHLKIELSRQRLLEIAAKYGREHPLTLAQSRRLDKLINEWPEVSKWKEKKQENAL